jgi:hypothetical protein
LNVVCVCDSPSSGIWPDMHGRCTPDQHEVQPQPAGLSAIPEDKPQRGTSTGCPLQPAPRASSGVRPRLAFACSPLLSPSPPQTSSAGASGPPWRQLLRGSSKLARKPARNWKGLVIRKMRGAIWSLFIRRCLPAVLLVPGAAGYASYVDCERSLTHGRAE